MKKGKMLRMSAALVATAVLVSLAVASTTGTKAIKERHEAMERVKDSMMPFVSMAKKQKPFDAAAVQASAKAMEGDLKAAADMFPEGSDKGDAETWAKAEIWSDHEDFKKMFQSSIEAAAGMKSVEAEADLMPALGALGNTCKSCHDKFRRPKS